MPRKKKTAVLDESELVMEYSPNRQIFISDTDTKGLHESVYMSSHASHAASTSMAPPSFIPNELRNESQSVSLDATSSVSNFVEDTEKTRTQRARLLAEYSENFALVARLLMAKEADHRIGSVCECNEAPREVRCFSCMQRAPLCRRCWVQAHVYQPLHWAHVWSERRGYFTCQDISTVFPEGSGISLGHSGDRCPRASEPVLMTIADQMATAIRYRHISGHRRTTPDGLHLRTPPALDYSQFTVEDYSASLCSSTSSSNGQRVYRQCTSEKRSGVFYGKGMKEAFPLRPPNDLRTGCFICPEAQVNVEDRCDRTPEILRHTQSQRWVVDGNMKTGNFVKNSDPDDASLFAGRAYMPLEQQFEHYQQTVPQSQKEKTTCNHLKVANGANTANVDIMLGERFALYDYALNLALEARPFPSGKRPDLVISYDNNCGAVANVHSRWQKYFPQNSDIINGARFTIPACHVHNHVEGCDYLYCYQYKPSTGHFHGAVLQMGPGHRIDTLIIHYSDWNWRKAVSASRQLLHDLEEAKIQYISKRDHYAGLCDLFESRVLEWNTWDRSPKIDPKKKKTVTSVYSHNNEKAPTMKSLVESLVSAEELVVVSTGAVKAGSVASWLMEGLAIVQLQSRIQRIARTCPENPTKELRARRTKLANRISKWRQIQHQYMPSIAPGQALEDAENESLLLPSDFTARERLQHGLVGLASKQVQTLEIALGELIHSLQTTVKTLSAAYERKHKHASGQDANTRANGELRTIETKRNNLISNYNMFRQNLHALDSLDDIKWPSLSVQDTFRKPTETRRAPGDSRKRDGALWQLSSAGRSTVQSEFAGDLIFGNRETDVADGSIGVEEPVFDTDNISYIGTQMSSRRGTKTSTRHTHVSSQPKSEQSLGKERMDTNTLTDDNVSSERKDGWIWHTSSLKHMSASELEKWEDKNDSVQWFRAEADMERWQEQLEIKHAEFLWLIASFTTHRNAWESLAKSYSDSPGHLAYAREHQDMFDSLRVDAEEKYRQCALPFFRHRESGESLENRIMLWRREEEKLFKWDRWSARPPFHDPTIFKHGGDMREPDDLGGIECDELAGVKRKFDEI
ncbi:hypothetical protein C8R42DRAFT_728368 [Lentinula raphanica]|nr:hypothetical protein C8R42DRAFT_728368 [Lentinula raphanica]